MDVEKLIAKLKRYDKKIASNQILHRIGLRLTNRLKVEVTRLKIIDSGRLRNSIGYDVKGDELSVGVFGVRYAKFHEFGTKPSARMARFILWKARQSNVKKPSKGVIEWSGRGRDLKARIRPRPFFYNTIESEKDYIYDMIKAWYSINADT
jgi:phage gpG-like protein